MLAKVAHYAGFQSYGDLAYPSLKAGKKELESNTVYQETVRQQDELKFFKNSNRWNTVYDDNLSKNIQPENYQNAPEKVTSHQFERSLLADAGRHLTLTDAQRTQGRFASTPKTKEAFNPHEKGVKLYNQTVKSLKVDQEDLNQTEGQSKSASNFYSSSKEQKGNQEYLASGTEHWKSTYVAGIKDPYSLSKATRPEWTLHKPAYSVQGGPRTTEAKGQFGERGANPLDKLSRTLPMPPVIKSEEALKLGTTQCSFHVPGYTGHIPKSLVSGDTWDQALGVKERTTGLKQNITENYQTRIPGYAGHRPSNAVNDRGALRQFCFATTGERFH
jgi:hypothetical protein